MDDVYDCWIAVEVTSGAQDGCYAERSDCYEVCDFLETRYPFTTWLAMLVPGDQRAKVDSEFSEALSQAKLEGLEEQATNLADILPTLQNKVQTR